MARRKESLLQQPWDFLNSSKKKRSSSRDTKSNNNNNNYKNIWENVITHFYYMIRFTNTTSDYYTRHHGTAISKFRLWYKK